VHALVPPLGPDHRLGGRHDLRPRGGYNVVKPTLGGGTQHFAGSLALIPVLAQLGYIALTAFVIDVIVATAATFVLQGAEDPGRHNDHHQGRLLRRRRRPASQAAERAHPPGGPLRLILAPTHSSDPQRAGLALPAFPSAYASARHEPFSRGWQVR
jgi:hypothetical protein